MDSRRAAQVFQNTVTNLLRMAREMTETKFKGKIYGSTNSKYVDWNNENIITYETYVLASNIFQNIALVF
jgi:hypothetical protein